MGKMDTILHYMFYCHRIPERSFHFKGKQFPLCARCTGILVGYFIGIICIILIKKSNVILEAMCIMPTIIDGIGQFYGKWISNNKRRFLTGLLAGIGMIGVFRFACVLGFSNGQYMRRFL